MRSALFFGAFEGSFLRRRRLEGSSMRSALFFWLLRDRFCDVAVWGGGGEAKKMNKIIEMPF